MMSRVYMLIHAFALIFVRVHADVQLTCSRLDSKWWKWWVKRWHDPWAHAMNRQRRAEKETEMANDYCKHHAKWAHETPWRRHDDAMFMTSCIALRHSALHATCSKYVSAEMHHQPSLRSVWKRALNPLISHWCNQNRLPKEAALRALSSAEQALRKVPKFQRA